MSHADVVVHVNITNSETFSESLKVELTNLWDKDYYAACILSWGRDKNVLVLIAIMKRPGISAEFARLSESYVPRTCQPLGRL